MLPTAHAKADVAWAPLLMSPVVSLSCSQPCCVNVAEARVRASDSCTHTGSTTALGHDPSPPGNTRWLPAYSGLVLQLLSLLDSALLRRFSSTSGCPCPARQLPVADGFLWHLCLSPITSLMKSSENYEVL